MITKSAMKAKSCVNRFKKIRRQAPQSESIKNKAIASIGLTSPVANGRDLVLSTSPSKFRSAKSFITHPALRMIKVPKMKIITKSSGGWPCDAIHKAVSVGQSNNKEPMGLSIRINFV